ncbi:ABC transporter ATP-binding protein [Nocardioides speluncae]|uniref:ABC transporter ATP-binding protein n=1 Tax=Nocardioides speluncae TaxID=2670337 RepID=UPI000D68E084|nr:ABC transporter ATP-binding protein [Nocardioides speluncae]
MSYAVPVTRPDPGETPELPVGEKLALLWQYVRPHRRVLAIGVGLGLAGTAAELATPMVTKEILDGLATDASLQGPVTVLALLLVAGTFIGLIEGILLGTLAERVILTARTGLVRHLLRVRVSELDDRPGGEMVARVTSDTLLIREATTTTIVYGSNGVISIVGALVLMAVLDVPLLLTTLAVIIGVAVLAILLMPALARAQEEAQAEIGHMGGRLEGILRALRTVKASRAEERESERIGAYAQRSAVKAVKAVRIETTAWTITGAGVNLAVMLVLGYGAYRVSQDALEVSGLVAFLLYLFGLTWPVMMLTMSLTALQSGLAAAARIHEVVSLELEPVEDDRPAPPADSEAAAVELVDVRFGYRDGAPPALDGVSLVVPRRGHLAIVGPSGAGKTTVFSLLLRFIDPDDGVMLLDGTPYAEWPLPQLRGRIAYVEQDTPLVPGSLRDNLAYAAPQADDAELWAALDVVRMTERVRSLPDGLDSELSPTTVSGGERQRIALARALVAAPEILLLDEVTAQLDGLTEAAVAEGIRRQAERGTVVTIAHRLSTVLDADRIVVLEAGRIRAMGTHDELLGSDELYAELVAALRIAAHAPVEVSG